MNKFDISEIVDWAILENALASNTYMTAAPFPHIVIDNVFNPKILQAILDHWPLANAKDVEIHDDGVFTKGKRTTAIDSQLSFETDSFLHQLGRPKFLKFLEKLTGIGGLISDPYYFGGGLHETAIGGKLAVHLDYNKHFKLKLDRRLNLLIYLNKNWDESCGGYLELWDSSMAHCVKKILPVFNRMVIFSTNHISYHGQPDPVTCYQGDTRKSVALYYYSNGRPEEAHLADESNTQEHTTLWQTRPGVGY